MSPAAVCSRPAVSASTTSMPRARAATSASWTTAAGSAPGSCATTGTCARSPHSWSCSTAAARNVSAAASSTVCPLAFKRCASLPTVVVLPVPLTPTAKITNGLCAAAIASGASTVASKPSAVCAQQLDGRRAGIAFVRRAHPVDEPRRRLDADVGRQQARLELLDRALVERLRAEAEQLRRQPVVAAVQARFELAEETRALLFVCSGGHAVKILVTCFC